MLRVLAANCTLLALSLSPALAAPAEVSPSRPHGTQEDARSKPTRTPNHHALTAGRIASSPSPRVVTPPASFSLNLSGDLSLGPAGRIFLSDIPFIHNDKGSLSTAVGWDALTSATSGESNTAFGHDALTNTTEGSANTAVGSGALAANDSAYANTAVGSGALQNVKDYPGYPGYGYGSNNTAVGHGAMRDAVYGFENVAVGTDALSASGNGFENVAVGHQALLDNLSVRNTAIGHRALASNTVGASNVAVGEGALQASVSTSANTAIGRTALYHNTGYNNIAIGAGAGFSLTTGDHNIAIGVNGVAGESSTTRIGNPIVAGRTFVAGIEGVTTDINDAIPVLIDSAGQLGTISSSARFKEDIHDLGSLSARLTDLRPVTFRYKKPFAGGAKPVQFGLIAEEVAEVFPELVVYDEEGKPETVKYHLLSTLLLNEVQRQEHELNTLGDLNQEMSDLRALLAERERQHQQAIADLERRLDRLATKKRSWH